MLTENLKSILNRVHRSCEYLVSTLEAHQCRAAFSVARTAKSVLASPLEEAFTPDSGLGADVPITACHVTPSLVVVALQKAVEQVVVSRSSLAYGLVPDGDWDCHVGYLMKALASLQVTLGGSRVARAAIQSLMRKHGDILSECWPV